MSLAEVGTMCTSCRGLSLGTSGVEPHSGLRLQGMLPMANPQATRERQYRCVSCHTTWLRRIDKWGIDGGFRLAP